MTTAVLKNRILLVSGGSFREAAWNADSFSAFLAAYPNVVTIDRSESPPKAVLIEALEVAEPSAQGPEIGPWMRIRSDLWRAALDYSSGLTYFWESGRAQAGSTDEANGKPIIPTASATDVAAWRAEFVAAMRSSGRESASTMARLERWNTENRPDAMLPRGARGNWNATLKRHVYRRLDTWFRENGLEPPKDITESTRVTSDAVSDEADQLRALLIECIALMTPYELRNFPVPASVIARLQRR